ncbi:T9SS type A sorting domain-containing protein [Pontibacter ruber]|uniref:T9SS type A sorting domain-containing protein n=1 Tax=Pontibacter ruber TaxID=1343895 RepID=A0ABW5CW95_9BACT|nr:T9SS type A sorting domain-containing protein [Pontibacter ruber]
MKRYIFLLVFIFSSLTQVTAQDGGTPAGCTEEVGCFTFQYLGATENADDPNIHILTYTLQVNCSERLEYVAFELPEGKKAATPADVYARDPKYNVYNGTTSGKKIETEFNAIQFTAKNKYDLNNGAIDTFRYYLETADLMAMQDVRIQAKSGGTVSNTSFNFEACGIRSTTPEPFCTLGDENMTFGFINATDNEDGTTTVRFSLQNNTATDLEALTIEVADAPQPLAIEGNGAAYRAKYNYQVEIDAAAGIISYNAQNTRGFANGQRDMFVLIMPTEAYNTNPYFTLSATAGDVTSVTGFNTVTCEDTPLTPLPVELVSFQGKVTQSSIELNWTTASEKDNDRFEVEHSQDGHTFAKIGTVKGAGNSNVLLHYNFSDKKAAQGTNYYRIRQVDFDGKYELSNVIAIENRASLATTGMVVYPNPATGSNITISLGNAASGNTLIRITNMNGRVVFTQEVAAGEQQVDISLPSLQIPQGMYMVSLQDGSSLQTQKLIIR